MNINERRVLTSALNSLSVIEPDLHVYTKTDRKDKYNYDCLGRIMIGKWMLAEMLGVPEQHLLPGESSCDAEDGRCAATVRCIKRKIAEVAGHPDLSHFRLLCENEVQPLYLDSYQPLS